MNTLNILWYPIHQADPFHIPVLPVPKSGGFKQINIESFGTKNFPLNFPCIKNIDPEAWCHGD